MVAIYEKQLGWSKLEPWIRREKEINNFFLFHCLGQKRFTRVLKHPFKLMSCSLIIFHKLIILSLIRNTL